MERETRKFTTPISNQEVEIKTYITGREIREITNSFLKGNVSFNVEEQNVKGLNPAMMDEKQNLVIANIVVSINGKKDGQINILDTILDMRLEDYNCVIKEITDVETGKKKEQI